MAREHPCQTGGDPRMILAGHGERQLIGSVIDGEASLSSVAPRWSSTAVHGEDARHAMSSPLPPPSDASALPPDPSASPAWLLAVRAALLTPVLFLTVGSGLQ